MCCCRLRPRTAAPSSRKRPASAASRRKKIETLRKLERVDQNLQRLNDILEEVEKQLRSVQLQAAKAQRYQEYTARLKELRVALGLQEYHQLTESLDAEARSARGAADGAARGDGTGRRLGARPARFGGVADAAGRRRAASRRPTWRRRAQQIAAEETTLAHGGRKRTSWKRELSQTRQRLAELSQTRRRRWPRRRAQADGEVQQVGGASASVSVWKSQRLEEEIARAGYTPGRRCSEQVRPREGRASGVDAPGGPAAERRGQLSRRRWIT